MKLVVSALAAAFLGTLGAGSAAQAAVIDFSAVANCPATCSGISYTGPTLRTSSAVDLDGSVWSVSLVNASDDSGLVAGDPLTIVPPSQMYGALNGSVDVTLTTPIVKTWTGTEGDFTETLTKLTEVDRGFNSIAFVLTGTVTGGVFDAAPAVMQFSLTQAGGPGNVVSASLTNHASTVPEPATWVMMMLGFAGLGYAAVRRSSKDRRALAI